MRNSLRPAAGSFLSEFAPMVRTRVSTHCSSEVRGSGRRTFRRSCFPQGPKVPRVGILGSKWWQGPLRSRSEDLRPGWRACGASCAGATPGQKP
eukprot:13894924-Alexandrium_andersonii.AAC.1